MIPLLWTLACAEPPLPPTQQPPGTAALNGSPDGRPPPPVAPGQPGGGKPAFHAEPDFQLVGEPSPTPRSIVLISLDTVRADRLGVYGGRAETPTLGAFAAEGVRFDQAITHFPETCLSHWSMHSGVQPEAHGNAPANGGSLYRGPTVAEIASRHGYSTAAFVGGITLTDQSCGLARGFATYDDRFAPDAADMKRPGAEVTRLAVDWIRAQQGPYFAFVHYFDAHFPYTPTSPWDTRYDPAYTGTLTGTDRDLDEFRLGRKVPTAEQVAHVLALYDGELSELDTLLAPLLAAIGPDTVVLITADHGESFEHNYWFNHRAGLWDGVVRVPLLLRAPGMPAGLTLSQQVGLIDVAPTLLTLAGLPVDARMQGRDLSGLREESEGGRERVYSLTDPFLSGPQWAVRTPTWKVIEQPDGVLYYDLLEDPQELQSRAGHPTEALAAARAAYRAELHAAEQHQAPAPQGRAISPEEQERLEALGYVVSGEVPTPPQVQPPPGQPPPGAPPPGQPLPGEPGQGALPPGLSPGVSPGVPARSP